MPPSLPPDFQPVITANYGKRSIQWVLFVEFWITIVAIIFINKPFYDLIFEGQWWWILIVPLSIYGMCFQFAFFSLMQSWIVWKILCVIERPKEGEFSMPGREFNYYCLRFWVQYFALYMMRAMPLPWADMICFRLFGCKIGKSVVLYDSWIDMEFVEIGDYVMLSLNAALFSHCIYHDKFLVKRVVVHKNGIVGAEAIVAPGTVIEEGAILGAASSTHIDQVLEPYLIHVGNPASMKMPIKVVEDEN